MLLLLLLEMEMVVVDVGGEGRVWVASFFFFWGLDLSWIRLFWWWLVGVVE